MLQAVDEKRKAEDISSVLYPNDATEYGKELRLKQQFFFVSASIQVSGCCIAVRHTAIGGRCADYLGDAVLHPDLSDLICSGCDGTVQGDWPQELEGLSLQGVLPNE